MLRRSIHTLARNPPVLEYHLKDGEFYLPSSGIVQEYQNLEMKNHPLRISLRLAFIPLCLLLSSLPALAESGPPSPYSIQTSPSLEQTHATLSAPSLSHKHQFKRISPQRFNIRVRELGWIEITLTQIRDSSTLVISHGGVKGPKSLKHPSAAQINGKLLRGHVKFRHQGRKEYRQITAALTGDSGRISVRFALPRRSTGSTSFYLAEIAPSGGSRLKRTPSLAATGRSCGHALESAQIVPDVSTPHSQPNGIKLASSNITYKEVDIAVVADNLYLARSGGGESAVSERIISLFDQVSAIFERDLGITIRLSQLHLLNSASEQFSSDNAEVLLQEIEAAAPSLGSADIYHLLTGRNIYGLIGETPNYNVIGLAYLAQACTQNGYPYSLTEKFSDTLDYLAIAHELGHNFGANHDQFHTTPSTIMFPALPPAQIKFSNFSKGEIVSNYLEGGFYNLYPGADNTSPTPIPLPLRTNCLAEVVATPRPTATPTHTPGAVAPSPTPNGNPPTLSLKGTLSSRGRASLTISIDGSPDPTCDSRLELSPQANFAASTRSIVELGSLDEGLLELRGSVSLRALIPRGKRSAPAYARARYSCGTQISLSNTVTLRPDRVRARTATRVSTWIKKLAQKLL
jgi:hypothetical protein